MKCGGNWGAGREGSQKRLAANITKIIEGYYFQGSTGVKLGGVITGEGYLTVSSYELDTIRRYYYTPSQIPCNTL